MTKKTKPAAKKAAPTPSSVFKAPVKPKTKKKVDIKSTNEIMIEQQKQLKKLMVE